MCSFQPHFLPRITNLAELKRVHWLNVTLIICAITTSTREFFLFLQMILELEKLLKFVLFYEFYPSLSQTEKIRTTVTFLNDLIALESRKAPSTKILQMMHGHVLNTAINHFCDLFGFT